MSTKAHIETDLSLKGRSIPIDDDTVELFHFDISANGVKGTRPMGAYVDDSTVLYYDMGETFTNSNGTYVVDKSQYGNYGKVNGATLVGGRNGKAMSFDGVNDYIDLGNTLNMGLNDMSFSLWIKTTTTGSSYIFSKSLAGAQTNRYGLGINTLTTGTLMVLASWDSSGHISYNCTKVVNDGSWHHVAVIFDRDVMLKVYVDGILDSEFDISSMQNVDVVSTNPFRIGSYTGGDNVSATSFFNGSIDKTIIYNRALSPEEILSHYNEGIYTLRENGRYGKSIAIESSTRNLLIDGLSDYSALKLTNWSGNGTFTEVGMSSYNTPIFRYDTTGSSYRYTNDYILDDDLSVLSENEATFSMYVRRMEGDTNGRIRMYDNASSYTYNTIPVTTKFQKFEMTKTIGLNPTRAFVMIDATGGGTYELHSPQLEIKSFATSFIDGARTEGKLHYTNELINPTEFTISMWVKGAGVAFSLNDPSGTFLFQAGVGSLDWNAGAMSMEIPTEDWNMMAVSFSEAGGWKLYNNGKLITEDNNPYILTVPTGSYISVGCYGEVASNVMIDELRIDKIARTDEEIEQWYISQAPFFPLGNERIVL